MIIDMHVHLSRRLPFHEWIWRQWPGTPEFMHTAEQFLKKMNTSKPRIDKALVFGFRSLNGETPQIMIDDNDYILKVVEEHPERYIGAGLIDPSWGKRSIKELKRIVKKGLRVLKIKFTSVHFPANCPGAKRLFQEIDDLGILPVIHSDWTHWSSPSTLGDLMMNYPALKMVMQHFGLTQSLEAIEIAKNNENIYVDTSAVIHPRNIIRFIEKVSPKRIMYASDTIRSYEKTMPQEEIDRILHLDLSKRNLDKILGGNAEKLLKSVGIDL
jgi:predicted TIM-barrel fold metal-dependent hydrolase